MITIIGPMDPTLQLVRVMQALGQDTRLKILKVLSIGSFCVCELEKIFGISQPAISHHLGILKDAGLVESSREGQWIFYNANKDGIEEYMHMLDNFLTAPIRELPQMSGIAEKIEEVERDPQSRCRRTGREG